MSYGLDYASSYLPVLQQQAAQQQSSYKYGELESGLCILDEVSAKKRPFSFLSVAYIPKDEVPEDELLAQRLRKKKDLRSVDEPILRSQLTHEQQKVADLVTSGKNIFLTGVAGTGKSFLFQFIAQELSDRLGVEAVAVVAPTGVAAVNVGGVTLHSFAGIGLGTGPIDEIIDRARESRKTTKRWQKTKALLVDEISMVDDVVFDKISKVGSALRGDPRPFGGIQLVVCGDFFQLPPVGICKAGKKGKTFCFASTAWKDLKIQRW